MHIDVDDRQMGRGTGGKSPSRVNGNTSGGLSSGIVGVSGREAV